MAKFCGNCGIQLDDDARVCGYCGTPIENEIVKQKKISPKTKKKIRAISILSLISSVIITISIITLNTIPYLNDNERPINEFVVATSDCDNDVANLDSDKDKEKIIKENLNDIIGANGTYYQSDKVVSFEDQYIAIENGELKFCYKKGETGTDYLKTLSKENVNSFTTDGDNIFYSITNNDAGELEKSNVTMPSNCKIFYSKTDGSLKQEITTTYGYGYPLTFANGLLYFIEYKQDYVEDCYDSMAVYSYNLSTGEKKLLQNNVCRAIVYNNVIILIDMDSSSKETQNLKFYDIKKDRIQKICSGSFFTYINCDEKYLVYSQEEYNSNTDSNSEKVYRYHFDTGKIEQKLSYSGQGNMNIQCSNEKYIFYSIYDIAKNEYSYYRCDMDFELSYKIHGLKNEHYYGVFLNADKAYYYCSENSIQFYPLEYNDTEVSDEFSKIYYTGSEVVAIQDGFFYIRNEDGNIFRKEISIY